MTTTHPTAPAARVPLNTLAIGFGLAGLASLWSVAETSLGAPAAIADALWIVAGVAWVWLLVAHALRGRRSADRLVDQLRHPVQGPVAALAPVVGMLLGARLHLVAPAAGTVLVLASIAVSAGFAGWILAQWTRGGLDLDAVHGGYLLPTVASGLVAAVAAARIGLTALAIGAFAVGLVFWVVLFAVILARLAARTPLPAPLVPTLAILVAPPAVAGAAWIAITGEVQGPAHDAFLALTVVLVLMQFALAPRFARLPFSLGFWSFTFPYAAAAGYLATEAAVTGAVVGVVAAWVLVAVGTAVILAIAARSLVPVVRGQGTAPIAPAPPGAVPAGAAPAAR
ncbi:transporter [Agromyces sp. MMS24-K17]|uniref:SLAC1 family transporter n=1 Tax=Agromyces sp. MMS24-K17 TaxID=3372850 RepID=UPI0037547E9B